ncbi:MAG: AbrB/MazE/SpoVT family DNA-binding domain-containing protein [Candidatus Omnitrophica bacterium]|nr:AbrB/MazE/SpoVT family DNA-binding domain-containing protein [Candidatus Omnitrophota bacterium]
MTQVTISSKYQVVIPKEVRQQVSLHTGQKLAVIVKEGVITLLPDKPLHSFRGFLKGMPIDRVREKKDRL